MILPLLESIVFKLTQERARGCVKLRLEGRLAGDHCRQLDRRVRRLLLQRTAIEVDLGGLQFADATGLAGLCRLVRGGARVLAASPFVAQLLKEC